MPCVFRYSSSIESCSLEALLDRSCAGLEGVEVGHLGCHGCKRWSLRWEDLNSQSDGRGPNARCHAHLVVLHTVVRLVQVVHSPSPRPVVTGTTVSPIMTSWQKWLVYLLISSTVRSWWLLRRWRAIITIPGLR